jgi:hypothetical protein
MLSVVMPNAVVLSVVEPVQFFSSIALMLLVSADMEHN